MRRLIVAGILTALSAALLAVPASASFQPHFNVIAKQTAFHQVGPRTFRSRAKFLDPRNLRKQVGRDRATCHWNPHHFPPKGVKCRVFAHFNGRIGGFGNIELSGGCCVAHVVGGTGDFKGVTGKLVANWLRLNGNAVKFHFDLRQQQGQE